MQQGPRNSLEPFYRVAARYYDGDYADVWHGEDVDMYRGLAMDSGGPVLEMGCGTGRVLLPLARAGITIHGIDASASMLDELRNTLSRDTDDTRGRVRLTEGDARTAQVGSSFALVIAPGHVIQSFFEREEQREFLRNVRRHLLPDGAFCFDAFQPDYSLISAPAETVVDVDRIDAATGYRWRRFICIHHELELQRFRVEMRWLIEDVERNAIADESATMMQHWFTRSELENLLELEGFRVTHYWGSFNRTPFETGSSQQVIRAIIR